MRSGIRCVLIPYLLLVAARLWLSWPLDVPVNGDELRFLRHARFLATGADPVEARLDTFYRAGYPVLLMPALLFADEPASAFKRVQVVNAFLMSLIYPLAFHLAGRLRATSPADRMLVAGCVSLYPAAMLYSTNAMSANVFLPAFFGVLVTAAAALQRPSWWRWTASFSAAVFLTMVHERALVIVAVLAMTFAGHLLLATDRRRGRGRLAIYLSGAVAVLALGLVGWATRPGSLAGSRLWKNLETLLVGLERPASLAVTASGQLWYLGLATCGLLFAGLLFSITSRPGRWRVPSLFWWVPCGSAAGVFAVSVVFLAPSWERFTYWIYGRYNEGVLLPLLVIALLGLDAAAERDGRRRLAISAAVAAALIIATGWVLASFWTPAVGPPYSFNATAFAIHAQPLGWGILRASASAVLGLAVLVSLLAWRWRWGVVGVGIFFALSTLTTYRDSWVERSRKIAAQQELIRRIELLAPEPRTIFWDPEGRRYGFNYWNVSYFLPQHSYRTLPRKIRQPSGELVLSGRLDLDRWYPGARLVGLENLTSRSVSYIQGLWVLPGPLQDTLEARRWLFPEDFPGRLGADVLRAELRLVEPRALPRRILQGEELLLDLEIHHRGSAPWPHRGGLWTRELSVGLLVRWLSAEGEAPAVPTWVDLPRTVYPGELVRRSVSLRSAEGGELLAAGSYRVAIALAQVQEGRPQASEAGTLALDVEIGH